MLMDLCVIDVRPETISIFIHLFFSVPFEVKHEPNALVVVPGCGMEMNVEYGLSGSLSVICENVEARWIQGSDDSRRARPAMEDFFRKVRKRFNMQSWIDHCMTEMNRTNIEDCDGVFILIKNFGVGFTPDDVAEPQSMNEGRAVQESKNLSYYTKISPESQRYLLYSEPTIILCSVDSFTDVHYIQFSF